MNRLPDENAPTPDSPLEAALRSYFATEDDQPPTTEAFWQRLSPHLEEISMRHTSRSSQPSQNHHTPTPTPTLLDAPVASLPSTGGDTPTTMPGKLYRSPLRRRISALGAIAAVIALVALFGLVLHSFLGPEGHPAAHPTATHQPTATATPSIPGNPWKQVAQFSAHQSAIPNGIVVGQNDPNVIYELGANNPTLLRSDDGGKTWNTLTLPGTMTSSDNTPISRLYISPVDAQVIWTSRTVGPEDPNCHVAAPGAGCTAEFVSTNGGNTWQPVATPNGLLLGFGTLGGLDEINNGGIVAQGQRLYAQLSTANPDPANSHLATSLDGVHWSVADTQLTAQGLVIMEYVATPIGSTIFASTMPQGGNINTSRRELWRSDDAGMHWADLGTFPSGPSHLMGAASVNGVTLVYYGRLDAQGGNFEPNHVFASANNGKTWQASPVIDSLVASGDEQYNGIYFGTLPDGSVVLLFGSATSMAMYSWLPGQAKWQQLSQDIQLLANASSNPNNIDGPWLTPAHDGVPAMLWVLLTYDNNGSYILWSCQVG